MPEVDAVIVDEVHTAVADQTGEHLRRYCSGKIAVGLSATPEFDEARTAYALFEHHIHSMNLQDAIRRGLLAPVQAFLLDAEPKLNFATLPTNSKQRKLAIRAARLEARMQAAEKIALEAFKQGLGVVARCPAGKDIDYAVQFANRLRDRLIKTEDGLLSMRWISAEPVGGSSRRQTRTQRRKNFEAYDVGEIDLLTYVRAIGMGWDSPNAKVHINLAPSTSMVEIIQAIGRVMRLVHDRKGNPIIARLYEFRDPELGGKQYTPLDALNLESGGLLQQETEEAPIPRARARRFEVTPELEGVIVRRVGELAIAHDILSTPPSQDELKASIATFEERGMDAVDLAEACRILGIAPTTFRTIYEDYGGSADHAIPVQYLLDLLELYPGLEAPRLPRRGYASVMDVAKQMPVPVRMFWLINFAGTRGLYPQRFMNAKGRVGFYFPDAVVPELARLVAEGYESWRPGGQQTR